VGSPKNDQSGVTLAELEGIVVGAVQKVMPASQPVTATLETTTGANGRVARLFEWLDTVLSYTTKLVLYTLEAIGVYWIFHFLYLYDTAIDMAQIAKTPESLAHAKDLVGLIQVSVESTYKVVIGLCTALPGLIAALRTVKKVQEVKQAAKLQDLSSISTPPAPNQAGPDQPA